MCDLCVYIFKLRGAEWGGQYYDICSIPLRCVFPIKSSFFRLPVKLHCLIERKKERERERERERKEGGREEGRKEKKKK